MARIDLSLYSPGGGGGGSTRTLLIAAKTFYFNADTGVDNAASGLTPGTPWKTLQFGVNIVQTTYDLGGQRVTMQLQDATATYAGVNDVNGYYSSVANSVVYYRGNVTTPANVKVGSAATVSTGTTTFDKGAQDPVQPVVVWANGLNLVGQNGGASYVPSIAGVNSSFIWGTNFGPEATNILVSNLGGSAPFCQGNVGIAGNAFGAGAGGTITFTPSTFTFGNLSNFWADAVGRPSFATMNNVALVVSGGGTLTIPKFLASGINTIGNQITWFNMTLTGSFSSTYDYYVGIQSQINADPTRSLIAGAVQLILPQGVLTDPFSGFTSSNNGANVVAAGTQSLTPVAAGTTTFANTDGYIIFTGAATIATHTVVMKPNPIDQELVTIYAGTGVTAVTWNGNGHAINGSAPAGIAAGSRIDAIYNAATTTWYVVS